MSTGRKVRFAALTAILLAVFSLATVLHAGQHAGAPPTVAADASFCGVCAQSADTVALPVGVLCRMTTAQPLPEGPVVAMPAPDVRSSSSRGPPSLA